MVGDFSVDTGQNYTLSWGSPTLPGPLAFIHSEDPTVPKALRREVTESTTP